MFSNSPKFWKLWRQQQEVVSDLFPYGNITGLAVEPEDILKQKSALPPDYSSIQGDGTPPSIIQPQPPASSTQSQPQPLPTDDDDTNDEVNDDDEPPTKCATVKQPKLTSSIPTSLVAILFAALVLILLLSSPTPIPEDLGDIIVNDGNIKIDESEGLRAQILALQAQLDNMTKINKDQMDAVLKGHENQLDAMIKGHAYQMDTTNKSHQVQIDQLQAQINALNGTIDKNQKVIAALESSKANLQSELNGKIGELGQMKVELNQIKGDANSKQMVFAKIIAGLAQAEGRKNDSSAKTAAIARKVVQREADLAVQKAAADAEQHRILSQLGKSQPPGTLKLGQSSDPLWETILKRNWDAHMARFGVGWNRGDPGSNTTDSERQGLLIALKEQYGREGNAQIHAQAEARRHDDNANLSRIQGELDAARREFESAQRAEVQANADYAAQMQHTISSYSSA